MAYFGFTNKLRNNETIRIFNYGNCKRDFTYVDDIVEGVKRVMQAAPEKKVGEDGLLFRRMQFIILATVILRICWSLWIFCSRN